MYSMQYTTQRLILKPVSTEDAPFIFRLMNTESWKKYIGDRKIESIDKAILYIESKMLPQYKTHGFGNYVILISESMEKIGTCGIYDREGLEGVDIGYALHPDYERNGYAYEASSKILQVAFEQFNLPLISGITTEANRASRKLLVKLGLTEKGTINLENDPETLLLYQIDRKTYEMGKQNIRI